MNENFLKKAVIDDHINMISPLNLAYIGDAVFELCVRTRVLEEGNAPVNALHKKSRNFVKAESQAKMYEIIKDCLTDEEVAVLKRGRNAKSATTAKNASISDYRHATGLEALFGYLYLQGNNSRVFELFEKCVSKVDTV